MTLPSGVAVAWREVPAGVPRREVSRALLAELLPGATVSSRCASCGGDHGRPRLAGTDAAVSVSYAPGWAVVALTRIPARIGVDAVPRDAGGLERVLPHGTADATGWARVEAVLKADGRGLAIDPARVEVRPILDADHILLPAAGDARAGGAGPGGTGVARWQAWIGGDGSDGDRSPLPPRLGRGWDITAPAGVVAAIGIGSLARPRAQTPTIPRGSDQPAGDQGHGRGGSTS